MSFKERISHSLHRADAETCPPEDARGDGEADRVGDPTGGSSYEADDVTAQMIATGHLVEADERIVGHRKAIDGPADLPKKRRPGRPRGRHYGRVTITVEPDLLAQIDGMAKEQESTRSAVIRAIVHEHVSTEDTD